MFNMEPEKDSFQKESSFSEAHFLVPCPSVVNQNMPMKVRGTQTLDHFRMSREELICTKIVLVSWVCLSLSLSLSVVGHGSSPSHLVSEPVMRLVILC